jgi:adenylylsulfate kinase
MGAGLEQIPTLIISGTVGAGKSQVADEISWILEERRIRHGLVDLDHLANLNPAPDDDPHNRRLALQNLARVWENYLAKGASRLVIAWALESTEELAGFQDAIPGADIRVVRLVASIEVVAERLRRREVGTGLDHLMLRTRELAEELDATAPEAQVVENDGRSVTDVADEILRWAGWL